MTTSNSPIFSHEPVLLQEVLEFYSWSEPGLFVGDLTIGGGGHLRALLSKCPRPKTIFAMDQDPEALVAAKQSLLEFEPIEWVHGNFRSIRERLIESGRSFDRVFIDLGVSSHQLDSASRGFSFQKDGPLDMRMNPKAGEPISDWLAHCGEAELVEVLQVYGDEPRARPLARRWLEVRKGRTIETTKDFVEALGSSLTAKNPKGRHPLTRVFQALRIKANDEFSALQDLIRDLPEILSKNGRVGILTFHSLEDREVKWGLRVRLKPVNKKAIQATREEQKINSRSRSAKLRVYEKA